MMPLDLHKQWIYSRRLKVLASWLCKLIPADSSVLDVGCGDGRLAVLVMESRRDVKIKGVDVLIRPDQVIEVVEYDGVKLPYDDDSFDVVSFVDVLHHTDDPHILLREAMRVARKGVLIKDHLVKGLFARQTLRAMDWVGNAKHHVRLPYNYWTPLEWEEAFQALPCKVEKYETDLKIYTPWIDWIFGRSLHFVAFLEKK